MTLGGRGGHNTVLLFCSKKGHLQLFYTFIEFPLKHSILSFGGGNGPHFKELLIPTHHNYYCFLEVRGFKEFKTHLAPSPQIPSSQGCVVFRALRNPRRHKQQPGKS